MEENQPEEPIAILSIGPIHLNRVTRWGFLCSDHGPTAVNPPFTREAALKAVHGHLKDAHRDGQVEIREKRW